MLDPERPDVVSLALKEIRRGDEIIKKRDSRNKGRSGKKKHAKGEEREREERERERELYIYIYI